MAQLLDLTKNTHVNLALGAILVAVLGDTTGKLLTRVFRSATGFALLLQVAIAVLASRGVSRILAKLNFHPEIAAFAKDSFGPFLWTAQGPLITNVSRVFSSLTPI